MKVFSVLVNTVRYEIKGAAVTVIPLSNVYIIRAFDQDEAIKSCVEREKKYLAEEGDRVDHIEGFAIQLSERNITALLEGKVLKMAKQLFEDEPQSESFDGLEAQVIG